MTEELDRLAETFALGLADERAEAELEARLLDDRDFRAAVARARDRLLSLDMSVAALPGAPALWNAILPRLGPTEAPGPAAPERPTPASVRFAGGRRWIPIGIAASVGILAGGLVGGVRPVPDPVVVAVLVDAAGRPTAVVEDYGSADARIRFVSGVDVPTGRQMQVWTLPSAEMGPVSLGLLEGSSGTELDAPRLPLPTNGQLYEITLEPSGGSPTGRPTGEILAKGLAARQDDV